MKSLLPDFLSDVSKTKFEGEIMTNIEMETAAYYAFSASLGHEMISLNAILANPPFGGIVANNNENNFPQNYRTKESADLFLILMIHLLKQGGRAGIVLPDGSLTGDGVKQRVRQKLLEECNLHTIIRLPNSVFQPYATVATNLLFFTKGTPTKEVWYYEHRLPEGAKAYNKTKPIQAKEFEPIKKWWNDRKESDIAWKVDIQTIIGTCSSNFSSVCTLTPPLALPDLGFRPAFSKIHR